jgi:NAD(P)-dependent dehydrogenase (short-subunit alcohol dehydrogenase family)
MAMPVFDFPKTEAGKRPVMLLTGASRGIGHATVKRFSRGGLARHHLLAPGFCRGMPVAGRAGRPHQGRSRRSGGCRHRGIAEIKKRLEADGGQLTRWSTMPASRRRGPNSRMDSRRPRFNDWHEVFQVNFFAPIMLARGLLDELAAAKGSIVNVTSIAGTRASIPSPGPPMPHRRLRSPA